MDGGIVEVIGSKGCSKLFLSTPNTVTSIKSVKYSEFMSSSPSAISGSFVPAKKGPFSGLVICVTGLSKEARQQVMAAAERLGGQYSSCLHPGCTHLVVQSCAGRKFEHALKHGQSNGLYVVTLGWFVDSVRKNVRLNESLYAIKHVGENGYSLVESGGFFGTEKSCLPLTHVGVDKSSNLISNTRQIFHGPPSKECRSGSLFSNDFMFIDPDVSVELRRKVVDAASSEGAKILDHWFIGSPASHIICESPSIRKYVGHADRLVTPIWVFKTVKEKCLQRLVHLSSDLVRHVAMVLENNEINQHGQDSNERIFQTVLHSSNSYTYEKIKDFIDERQKRIELAKLGVRNRRSRSMRSCQMPLHSITPSSLLEFVCWSVSEPTSSASIFTESSEIDDANSLFYDARGDGRESDSNSVESFSRPLRESEWREVVFKNHFLTVLFPIDRFGELGPSSRTFFSDGGFTCLQILDHIYNFYQESLSANEIEVAIHTDSRHADRLRSLYISKEALEQGFVAFRRIDFLGSRRYFEALKRISGQNNSNCYELHLRA